MEAEKKAMAKNRRGLQRHHLKWGIPGLGLGGLGCIIWAVVSLMQPVEQTAPKAGVAQVSLTQPVEQPEPDVTQVEQGRVAAAESSYYPLEIGRYWVYRHKDPDSDIITDVERRIVRREIRPEQELFFFSDGTVAYRQEGKVFEVGTNGGVNVIPLDAVALEEPYAYRSQGLYIEKSIGAVDTLLVWEGRRYESCIEVVTQFRRLDQGVEETRSFATYYARGIGLVGREEWPQKTAGQSSSVLRTYGVNHL
jgi:hypothetical protein